MYDNESSRWEHDTVQRQADGKLRPLNFWQRNRIMVIVLSILSVALVIFAASTFYLLANRPSNTVTQPPAQKSGAVPPTTISTPIPTTVTSEATTTATQVATTPPLNQGKLLYQADWSKDLNGWKGSPQWKFISANTIGSDGSDRNIYSLIAPYRPTTPDYAIETTIQFVRGANGYSGSFGVIARADASGNGYEDSVGVGNSASYIIKLQADNYSSGILEQHDYKVDTATHTYRMEVKANQLMFYIDGQQVIQTTDNTYLSPGSVGLYSKYSDIDVTSFKVFAL